jgi:2-phosphoglycerate kinase
MIYLIGGAPRVGKTQLATKVISKKPMHAISTDAIRYMLRRTIPPTALPQTLWTDGAEDLRLGSIQKILESQNAESIDLWPYLEQIMSSYTEDDYDLLLEGVAVIPSLVNHIKVPHRAIIIGNNSPKHSDTLLRYAADNPYDWLHKFNQEQVSVYTDFFAYMGGWLQEQAAEYDIPFVEIHDELFGVDITTAAEILLK